MTRIIRYAGVQLADNTIRLEDGIAGLTECADGSLGTAGVRFDDPTGADTYTLLQRFEIDETDCVLPRMFTGYSYNVRNNRGPFRIDGGRTHDLDIGDLNFLLHLQPARGSTAKRPLESGDARMAWLLSSVCLDGIVYDSGLVGSNPNMFDEADYTGSFADEIMPDLCVSSSDDIGRIFFAYWDENTQRPSLFIDLPTANVRVSDLRISNELSDVDDDITFAPYISPEVSGDGTEIYCSVFFKYKTGTIFVHNQTTHDNFFSSAGFHRQAVYETSRVGSLSTAQRHADQFLAAHSGQRDVITCTVKLPPSKVNLIGQGMLVSCKFEHLPTYETFTDLRVAQRTVLMTQTTSEYYDVQLTLNRYGITPAGGGPPPADFPTPPGGTPAVLSVVQAISRDSSGDYKMYPGTGTWDTVEAGHLLLLGVAAYDNGSAQDIPVPSGWTAINAIGHPSGTGSDTQWSERLFYKIADGGEVIADFATGFDQQVVVLTECDGTGTLVTSLAAAGVPGGGHLSNQGNKASLGFGALSTTAGEPILLVGWGVQTGETTARTTPWGGTYNETGDFEVAWGTWTNLGGVMVFNAVASSSGSERISFTMEDNNNFPYWCVAAFQGTVSATDNPPSPGQDIGWVVPTAVADGEDFTWAMPFPFSDGSLEVRLDGMDQSSAITSYDGVCGEFTVSFEVQPGELLEARAIGR